LLLLKFQPSYVVRDTDVATIQKVAIHAPPFVIYTDSVHSLIQKN